MILFDRPLTRKTREVLSYFHHFFTSRLTLHSSCVWIPTLDFFLPFLPIDLLFFPRHLLYSFLSSEDHLRPSPFSLLRKWSAIKNNPATLIDYNSNTLSCHHCSSVVVAGKLFNLGPQGNSDLSNGLMDSSLFLVLMDWKCINTEEIYVEL